MLDQHPASLSDLQSLVAQQVPESLHLDYKASAALSQKGAKEISKDVSAFANSDGGVIVYGIQETGHLPTAVDVGVDDGEVSREWLEQVIVANIAPRIEGVIVSQIEVAAGRSAYVVSVPKSFRTPHQDRQSHRYYRRYNFQSHPIEHWEVLDLQGRQGALAPLFRVRAVVRQDVLCVVEIENVGTREAREVHFECLPTLPWRQGAPEIISRGARSIAPGQRLELTYGVTYELLREGSEGVAAFEFAVSYYDPRQGIRTRDDFLVDFLSYRGTRLPKSDIGLLQERLTETLKATNEMLGRLGSQLQLLARVSSPTGLRMSSGTLQAVEAVAKGEDMPPLIDPLGADSSVFEEVLGVPFKVASQLQDHFWHSRSVQGLDERVGPDLPALEAKLRKWFRVEGSAGVSGGA